MRFGCSAVYITILRLRLFYGLVTQFARLPVYTRTDWLHAHVWFGLVTRLRCRLRYGYARLPDSYAHGHAARLRTFIAHAARAPRTVYARAVHGLHIHTVAFAFTLRLVYGHGYAVYTHALRSSWLPVYAVCDFAVLRTARTYTHTLRAHGQLVTDGWFGSVVALDYARFCLHTVDYAITLLLLNTLHTFGLPVVYYTFDYELRTFLWTRLPRLLIVVVVVTRLR